MRLIRSITLLSLIFVLGGATEMFALHTRTSTRTSYRRHTRTRRYRRVAWNPVLRGSHDSLLRQNEEINRLQLPRIMDDEELVELENRNELVPIIETRSLRVNPNLEDIRRYCRPWTRQFLEDVSEAYYKEFHQSLIVTSAVRTVEQQAKLRRRNRNAAPIDGETASSHLAGLTVDIGKKGMTRKQRKWFDLYLVGMQNDHVIEAAEERRQACYHIMVTERYTDWREQQNRLAENLGEQ